MYAWASSGAGAPALLDAGCPAIGSTSAASLMSTGSSSHPRVGRDSKRCRAISLCCGQALVDPDGQVP
eukprot:9000701-Pyramimonas_sp.AAC.1